MTFYHPAGNQKRQIKATSCEFERISKDPKHPCHKLLPDKVTNPYDLRRDPGEHPKYLLAQNDIKTHL